ncbi:MAG: folylpolyglutamate synthase/dihydrofolate synthase family protein [Phycisphaerales bacterium]
MTKIATNTPQVPDGSVPFVDHHAAMDFLNSRANFERVRQDKIDPDQLKLTRMRALMAALGDPQSALQVVHVAGSKGKGSTCEMVASCLEASGYTTGLFTSPHLIDVRERVRLGGENVSEAIFDAGLSCVRDAADRIESEHGACTYFEILTAVGLLIFAEQAVDVAVLEVGLGGRMDCTNVVNPLVVGLASIQLEHTQILGDSLEQIATEKAGIMKPGVIAVTVPQEDSVIEVFRQKAVEVGAQLRVLGQDVVYSCRFESGHGRGPHPKVCVGEEGTGFEHLSVPLLGEHQAPNCGLALAILCELREKGFKLPERTVAAGLEQTPRRGRLEEVHSPPRIVVDGAHTPESVRTALRAAGAHMRYDSMVVVFGCASDKDIDGMLDELVRGADKVIFTKSSYNPRAADPAELGVLFAERGDGPMCLVEPELRGAINAAARAVGKNDVVLVIGSFYLAGETKAMFDAKHADSKKS